MEANTLRLGNYVYDDFKEIHKVEFISSDEYKNWIKEPQIILSKINGLKGFYQSDEVFPIPLSEDILLKLGFEKVEIKNSLINKCYYHIDDFEVEFHGDRLVLRIYGGESAPHLVQYFAHHTKFIHQLQNLYFSIKNEELTIKE